MLLLTLLPIAPDVNDDADDADANDDDDDDDDVVVTSTLQSTCFALFLFWVKTSNFARALDLAVFCFFLREADCNWPSNCAMTMGASIGRNCIHSLTQDNTRTLCCVRWTWLLMRE
jgi:hypothetical protein